MTGPLTRWDCVKAWFGSEHSILAFVVPIVPGMLLAFTAGSGAGAMWALAGLVFFIACVQLVGCWVSIANPSVRARLETRRRASIRDRAISGLIEELSRHLDIKMDYETGRIRRNVHVRLKDDNRYAVDAYNAMLDRIQALRKAVDNGHSRLSGHDVERIEEALVDYLSLWVSRLSISNHRLSTRSGDIEDSIKDIEKRIKSARSQLEHEQLVRAVNDHNETLARRDNMRARDAAIEAVMRSLPDKVEEIHQLAMLSRSPSSFDNRLEDCLSRLHIAERVDEEMRQLLAPPSPSASTPSRRQASFSATSIP